MDMMETAVQASDLAPGGTVPEWVHILPIGKIEGRDGRDFDLPNPATVINAFAANGADLPVDYEHQADNPQAKASGPIPAAGWIKALKATSEGVFARIDWTDRARAMIAAKEYRFISPVIRYNKLTRQVGAITGAGLVHRPNLFLTALSSQEPAPAAERDAAPDAPASDPRATGADFVAQLAKQMGLSETTTGDEVLASVGKLLASFKTFVEQISGKAVNEQSALMEISDLTPDPTRFVPAGDLALMREEHRLAAEAVRADRVTRKVEDAAKAGYITRGQRTWATALCTSDEALFDSFCRGVPTFGYLLKESHASKAAPERAGSGGAMEEAICSQLGLKPGSLAD